MIRAAQGEGGRNMGVKKQNEQEEPGCPGEHFGSLVPDEVIAAYKKLFAAGRVPKETAV